MKRILSTFLITALIMQTTLAAGVPQKFPTDTVQMGKSGSAADKKLIFDVGDGASNPSILIDSVNKDFDLSKTLNVTGDSNVSGNQIISGNSTVNGTGLVKGNLTIGSGVSGDKSITVNRGGSNPYLKWSETDNSWLFSNDGTLTKKIGSGSGSGDRKSVV